MKKKRWIVILLLAAIGAGGVHLWSKYRSGSEVADPYRAEEMDEDAIRTAMRSEQANRRSEAFGQLGKLEPAVRRDLLLSVLDAPPAASRLGGVSRLAEEFAKEPEVADRLIAVAKEDADLDVRLMALEGLQTVGDARVPDLVRELLASPDTDEDLRFELEEMAGRPK